MPSLKTLENAKKQMVLTADVGEAVDSIAKFSLALVAFEPTVATLAALGPLLAKAVKACATLIGLLVEEPVSEGKRTLPRYGAEHFDQLFYVLCQRSYLESLTIELRRYPPTQRVDTKRLQALCASTSSSIASPTVAEARYSFGWDPDKGEVLLFRAYAPFVRNVLLSLSVKEDDIDRRVMEVEKQARKGLRAALASEGGERGWIAHYQLLTKFECLADLVAGYFNRDPAPIDDIWKNYRDELKEKTNIPMWGAERLTIDDIFVLPQYSYFQRRDIGPSTEPALPTLPLDQFLVALVSERRPSTEPVFVMGGPGLGKTSLMEVFSARVSAEALAPIVLVPAKSLDTKTPLLLSICRYLDEVLGYKQLCHELPETRNLIIIIDGFDELAQATRSTLEDFFSRGAALIRDKAHLAWRLILTGRPTLFQSDDVAIPNGAHVVNVLPFDKARVHLWGERWRAATGSSFSGVPYLESKSKELSELATQPMLLFLLAKMHDSQMPVATELGGPQQSKYAVYSRILDWVCRRQQGKGVEGQPEELRSFLRVAGLATHQSGKRTLHWDALKSALHQRGLVARPEERDAKAYGTILAFAFTSREQKAWEFTHKSFGEALCAEAMGEALLELALPGSHGRPWQRPLPDAVNAWVEIFGPHYLTWDVAEYLRGWMRAQEPLVIRNLIRRIPDLYEGLLCFTGSVQPQQGGDRSPIRLIGNAMRSWFVVTSSAVTCAQLVLGDDDREGLFHPRISARSFRDGLLLCQLVEPIRAGESQALLRPASRFVDGLRFGTSALYAKSVAELYRYLLGEIETHVIAKGVEPTWLLSVLGREKTPQKREAWRRLLDDEVRIFERELRGAPFSDHRLRSDQMTSPLEAATEFFEQCAAAGAEGTAVVELLRDDALRRSTTPLEAYRAAFRWLQAEVRKAEPDQFWELSRGSRWMDEQMLYLRGQLRLPHRR